MTSDQGEAEGTAIPVDAVEVPGAWSRYPAPPPPPDDIQSEGRRLSTDELVRRIERLESAADAPRPGRTGTRPWYRELSSLLAVIALSLSIGTTAISYIRTAQQDAHDRRVELTGLVGRINDISTEAVEKQVAYTSNPAVLSALARTLTQEQLLLAKQAARLMAAIPDQVGASEYALVASVLIGNNIDATGLNLLNNAVRVAADANDLVGSLRTLGTRLMAIGRVDEGRQKFGDALLAFGQFASSDPRYVASTHFDTQLFWAIAELQYGTCELAKQHAAEARSYVAKLPADDPRFAQLTALEAQTTTCTPAPSPSPLLTTP